MIELKPETTPVIEKTKELCEQLLQQDSFKSIVARLDAFDNDPEAQNLYRSVVELQQQLSRKQQEGMALSEEEIRGFEIERDKLVNHPIAAPFMQAQQEWQKLQDTVLSYLNKTLELGRIPTEDELSSGGCCGGGGGGGCGCH